MSDVTSPTGGRLAGVFWMLVSTASYGVMGAGTKVAVPMAGLAAVLFWRSVFITLLTYVLGRARGVSMRPVNHRLLFWRSLTGFIAMVCYFWALSVIPLATASALLYTNPVLVVLLAGVLIGERVPRGTLPLALAAFVGVLVIMRPDTGDLDLGAVAALTAGVMAALAYLAVRRLRVTDTTEGIVLYFSAFCVLGAAPFALSGAFGSALPEDPMAWWYFLVIGLGAAGGQLAMTEAYRLEKASVIGPFSYATVIWSAILGWWLFDEPVEGTSALGILLIIGAGGLLSRRANAEAT
ncbi:MAG: DMT family transporter [Myxococcota bacterium]|nr:DMT family transporter [Myxococcota bacterium]